LTTAAGLGYNDDTMPVIAGVALLPRLPAGSVLRGEGRRAVAKVLSILPEKCTACRACELACSLKHHGEFNPSRSRIKVTVFLQDSVYVPTACTQCAEAWCAKICPTNAIRLDDSYLAYYVDNARCVGCKMCVLACPFGAMDLFPGYGKAEKCDLCLSIDGDPECVKFCVPGALLFTDHDVGVRAKQVATAVQVKGAIRETG
jgi:carbon-monoxide dehydrogenase iron sulfur subunit